MCKRTKYDYINDKTLDQYMNNALEAVYPYNKNMFKLTENQYKHYLKFLKDHKDCRIDKETGKHKFGTIGGGLSIIYKSNDQWDLFDKYVKCHGCSIEEKLKDTNIELDISEDKLQNDYEDYCKYGPSFNKVEFYRFNEIWNEYLEDKGEQLEVDFMGTGLGHTINVKTKDFSFDITDISNW